MLHAVRGWLRYAVRRALDGLIGEQEATFRRLRRRGRIVVGRHTYGYPVIHHYAMDDTRLVIGSYCSISDGAVVMLGGEHPTDRVSSYPFRIRWGMEGAGEDGMPRRTGDTHIGSDVWLGTGCYLRSGVTIGHGAVVAANAVVTKDVPPYAVVAGNPARVVRHRVTEEQAAALLEIAWWDWPEEQVRAGVPDLSGAELDAFIARHAPRRVASSPRAREAVDRTP